MSLYDAPNQQVVRGDGSAPWDEGTGGSERASEPSELDSMTKDELLDRADELDLEVTQQMNKAEIRAAIEGG